ncbi:hypothetical protein GCM10009674_30160 [Nesterenkonia xinjiangensis]
MELPLQSGEQREMLDVSSAGHVTHGDSVAAAATEWRGHAEGYTRVGAVLSVWGGGMCWERWGRGGRSDGDDGGVIVVAGTALSDG